MDLQAQCELGQQQLMAMDYLQARRTLVAAEARAWQAQDWDTLARLYLPLQEARRQIRQRCGEGAVCLDLVAAGSTQTLDPRQIIAQFPHGQLLIAGWASLAPALTVRRLADEQGFFVETFLAATYPVGDGIAVVIAPLEDVRLPPPRPQSIDELMDQLPAHCVVRSLDQLPHGRRPGDAQTYAQTMDLWEQLHRPFLAAADMQVDAIQRMQACRTAIRVDDACELAHQKFANAARGLVRATTPSTR